LLFDWVLRPRSWMVADDDNGGAAVRITGRGVEAAGS
jgi:hypothetical protein